MAVRDWKRLEEALRKADLPTPEMRFPGEEGRAESGGRWLVKPRRGAAGAGIHFWRGEVLPRGNVLQEFLPGLSGSFTFLADGRRAVPVGCTEQLIGRKEFGGKPFAWSATCALSSLRRRGGVTTESLLRRCGGLAESFSFGPQHRGFRPRRKKRRTPSRPRGDQSAPLRLAGGVGNAFGAVPLRRPCPGLPGVLSRRALP